MALLHRLMLQPPNLGSCLVHQKLQVSFLSLRFLLHKVCFKLSSTSLDVRIPFGMKGERRGLEERRGEERIGDWRGEESSGEEG